MGVYRYTARAGVRNVEGVPMGEFKYAYKPWSGYNAPRGFDGYCSRADAVGVRAAPKLNDAGVVFMAMGGFPESEGVYSRVRRFEPGRVPSGYYDSRDPGEPDGYVAKVGGRLRYFEDRFDLANAIGAQNL